ncbi:CPBP family intramembrane glutamic endopeptidase [Bacillus mycoides]|uniref:CPBP family intramembrane glutamic endopeptidase n=1 Tax=Bacillus mycoides TaxID=1405 RepID=UPI0039905CB5
MKRNLNIYKNNKINFILYIIFFYSVWLLKEEWTGYIESFSNDFSTFFNAFIKILIWIIPTWIYIKFCLKEEFNSYIKLNTNIKKGFTYGIIITLLLGINFFVKTYLIEKTSFYIPSNFNQYINSIFIAGFTEEIVYRGLILNELQKRYNFFKSNIITAILFLIIHYPTWLNNEEFLILHNHIYILLLSLFLGYIYKKTNSLWAVIIIHSFHNLFVILN